MAAARLASQVGQSKEANSMDMRHTRVLLAGSDGQHDRMHDTRGAGDAGGGTHGAAVKVDGAVEDTVD